MFMGESDSTETQPSKPVCDWMIGLRGQARQAENPRCGNCCQGPAFKRVGENSRIRPLFESCGKGYFAKLGSDCRRLQTEGLFVDQMQNNHRAISILRA